MQRIGKEGGGKREITRHENHGAMESRRIQRNGDLKSRERFASLSTAILSV